MDEENDTRPKQNIRSKCHKPHTTYNLTLETLMKMSVAFDVSLDDFLHDIIELDK